MPARVRSSKHHPTRTRKNMFSTALAAWTWPPWPPASCPASSIRRSAALGFASSPRRPMRARLSTTTLTECRRGLCTRARVERSLRGADMTAGQGCMQKERSRSPSCSWQSQTCFQLHCASRCGWQLQQSPSSTASHFGRCALRLARPAASPRPRRCRPARERRHRRAPPTRESLAEVDDRNSESWRRSFSACCMRCTMLLDAPPEPPLGREASGYVP